MSDKRSGILERKYGQWAVVTGASDGIGHAVAEELTKSGLNLVVIARREELLLSLAREFRSRHAVDVRVLALDLLEKDAAETVVRATDDLDIGLLAAVAGFGTSGNFIQSDLQNELDMIDVNCRSVVQLCHHFGGRFAARKRGAIVLMSSLLAFQGVPRAACYAATKAFIQTFVEGLRLELASSGVDVIASAPGPVRSGFETRANMRMSMGANPLIVARGTLAALGHRGTVRPGLLSKTLEASLAALPRWGRSRIMALVMRGMTAHQDGGTTR